MKALKRKKVGFIPVQTTAISRRFFKQRGSRVALTGRPRKNTQLASQMVVGDDDESDQGILRHKLPTKKQRIHPAHNLASLVSANKRNIKKH